MKCNCHAGQIFTSGKWYCKKCGNRDSDFRRRPLTDYERLKLSWYRSEKKWIDNIRDRKIVRDKFGNKITVSQGNIIPTQPRELWAKPKGAQ